MQNFLKLRSYFDEGAAGGGTNSSNAGGAGDQSNGGKKDEGKPGTKPNMPIEFEKFIKDQPDEVKQAFEQYESGLKNTVIATRQERDRLDGQLREALKKAEKGSELEKTLQAMQDQLDEANLKDKFVEEAIAPTIACSNIKGAFLIAKAQNLFSRDGTPDWDAIKKEVPEFFVKKLPSTEGGSGSGQDGKKVSMNDFIRSAKNRS